MRLFLVHLLVHTMLPEYYTVMRRALISRMGYGEALKHTTIAFGCSS
jgi:hypothetical protein